MTTNSPSRACDYSGCRAAAVGTMPEPKYSWLRPAWAFCDEHAQQKWHPRDIRMSRFQRFDAMTTSTPSALREKTK